MHCIANIIRGATLLSRFDPCPLQDTNISPANDVCPHVAEYSAKILITFSHLTAPSAVHLTTCFRPDSQHVQALCTGIIAVISASTVCMLMYYSIYNSSCQMFYKSFEKNPVSKKKWCGYFLQPHHAQKTDRLNHTLSARTARVICHMTWKNY